MYNDRGIKMLTRIKTQEKEDNLLKYFQVCVHNWKKDWSIVYGPDGDKLVTDV